MRDKQRHSSESISVDRYDTYEVIALSEYKKYKVKTDMLRSIVKQSGESVESVLKKKGRLRWEEFAEKGFKSGMKQ